MGAFEDFVNLELPRRPTMLTTSNTSGFDGDPNGAGPAVITNAPTGTFYLRATGNVLYKKNSQTPGTWEVVGSGGGSSIPAFAKLFTLLAPALADLVSIHTVHPANGSDLFPGPITDPTIPRNLQVSFAAGWDGGDVTVTGTDQFDQAVSEVFTTGSGVTRVGAKIFKTVTTISKASLGATANTASVGIGSKLGVVGKFADTISALSFVDNIAEPATLDATYHGYTPTTLPDGVFNYTLLANVTE